MEKQGNWCHEINWCKRKDILIIFIFQGMIIGAIGAGVGTAAGLGYTFMQRKQKCHLTIVYHLK